VVIIIWAMEGRFPPSMAYGNLAALEEERRLMYVAATRARDRLFIYYPGRESVPTWSSYGGGGRGLSSFISSLPGDLFSHENHGSAGSFRRKGMGSGVSEKPALPRSGSRPFSQGDKVRHPAFGPGVVSRLVPGNKMEVLFKNFGKKLLHLEYTSLEKV